MAVKIEMEMPGDCANCRFCQYNEKVKGWTCYATEDPTPMFSNQLLSGFRRKFCPLQEVKE